MPLPLPPSKCRGFQCLTRGCRSICGCTFRNRPPNIALVPILLCAVDEARTRERRRR